MSTPLETQFRKAALALQQGNARTAKQGFLKLTKKTPDSPVVWYNLGLSYQYLGSHERAVSAYKRTVALDGKHADAWVNLALSHRHLGDKESARSCVGNALSIDSRNSRGLNLLGTLEAEGGRYEEARKYFEESLASQPGNVDASINLANVYVETGKTDAADAIIDPLLDRTPGDTRINLLKTRTLIERRRFDEAAAILRTFNHDDEEVLRAQLALHQAVRDHFSVIDVAGKLIKFAPNDAGVWNSLGGGYFQLDCIEQAQEHYQKAIKLEPGNAQYHNNLGVVFSSLGDKDSASECYRTVLELDPGNAEAYRNIATMKRYQSLSDPDIATVETLWRQTAADDPERIELAFALGKMYDDCGAYDDAFSVYATGNDLKFHQSHSELDRYFAHMDQIASVFTERPPTAADPVDGPQPIFVVGMPRSGTTLVEQILSRHPDVTGCGELPCIERAIMHLEKFSDPMRVYPDDFPAIPKADLTRQARSYTDWVRRLHQFDSHFLSDKMPYNFVHVWLIKAIFPDAGIIHCRRHPLDVIVSNYFQLYGSEVSFVYNLEALAEYTVRYFRLTDHWKQLFPYEIVDVQYESLVDDPDQHTRGLIEAVGLPWHDACLDPSKSASPVRTASIWQVRQGIYTSSAERWRNYKHHLGPAIDVLVENGILEKERLEPVKTAGA